MTTAQTSPANDFQRILKHLKRPLPAILCAFALGALSTLAMAPYELAPVLCLTLGGIYVLLNSQQGRLTTFACSWAFGFGYFLFGLSWIANALLVEGNEYAWAYPLALCVLPFMLSFFPALTLYIWRRFYNPATLSGFLGFTVCLGLSEWLRGHIFTGFPWNLLGYTWGGFLPVAQVAALSDVYLLTFLTILWGAALGFVPVYKATTRKKIIFSLCMSLSFASACLYGYNRLNIPTEIREDISFVLVQPNIAQSEKWEPDLFARHFNKHLDLTETQGLTARKNVKTTYIIWPETAIPLAFTHHPDAAKMIATTLQYYPETAFLLAGAISKQDKNSRQKEGYYNSLVVYNLDGQIAEKYDKFHLVPFGEYIPLQNTLNLKTITGFSGFERGSGPRTMNLKDDFFFSPLVCYEIIFPREVTDESPDSKKPDAIINVTNDGWYGISAGPYQHIVQTRFRAIEEGIPVIRAANTGFSAIIDPFGRVLYQSNLYEEATTRHALPKQLEIKKSTPYFSIIVLMIIGIVSIICKRFDQVITSHN